MSSSRRPRLLSLKFSLSCAFVSVVILTSILFCVTTFPGIKSFVREGIQERLGDSVGIASLQIDAEDHRTLKGREDENTAVYKSIKKQLQNIRDRGTGVRFVYTLRKNQEGKICFIVDAEENEEDLSHLGDVYNDFTPDMLKAFEKPYKVIVENEFYEDKWGNWLTSYAPILNEDGTLEAVLAMDISAEKVIAYERQYLLTFIIMGIIVSLIVALISLYISRRISKPLILLENDMAKMQRLELSEDVSVKSRIIEVCSMEMAVNNMKSGLRSFRKYVPADLVNELILLNKEAVLGAEKQRLSIFFCDIANFTTISESIPPEELAKRMSVYFNGMTKIIHKHGGTIDKYIGDCIMAFWGAPRPCDDHALKASLAAVECRAFVSDLTEKWQSEGLPPFHTRFGINTGDVVVGNIGYEERLNYTVMGDSVNLASRLEGLNKDYDSSIMISEFTYEEVKDNFAVRVLDIAKVKGKTVGVKVFEIIDLKDNLTESDLEMWQKLNAVMDLKLEGKLDEAEAKLKELSEEYPNEKIIRSILNDLVNSSSQIS